MWLLDRLRDLLSLGEETSEEEASADDAEPADERRCAICGTPVDEGATECPLCRSTDLVPAEDAPDRDGRAAAPETDSGTGTADADSSAIDAPTGRSDGSNRDAPDGSDGAGSEETGPGEVHSQPGDATESAAGRLNDLQEEREHEHERERDGEANGTSDGSDAESDASGGPKNG